VKEIRLLLFVFLPSLFACDGNYREVVISGKAIDSLTGQFVAGSDIKITCWVYDTDIWESRKVVKDTITDANGNFLIPFEMAEAIDVEVRHPNYEIYKYSMTLDRSDNYVDLKLKRKE